jgi:hypothetical protein
MAVNVPQLDTNMPIVEIIAAMQSELNQNGAPSQYFEELWYSLVQCLQDHEARITALEP